MMRKIMILAGGPDQAALIREIKQVYPDSYTILVDMNKDVMAAGVADKQLVISTMDFDKVRKAALDEGVERILTACGDQPLLTMGSISEELNLPCYLSKRQILDLTNKRFMKRLMIENGIPTSKYKSFDSLDDINDEGLEYPLIVKPADSNGSKGVRKVDNREELMAQAEISIKFSISHTIIVEEFVEGEDVSSDFYVLDGKVIHVMDCLSNKYKPNDEIAVIYQSIIPPAISAEVRQQLQSIAEKIAEVYGLNNTPLLIQTIIHGDHLKVVEFSARLGGGAKYKTIQTVTDCNILRANLKSMMGEMPEVDVKEPRKKYSRCHLYTHGGVLGEVTGLDDLLNNGVIEDYILNKKTGALVDSPKSSGDRVASIFVAADNFDELGEKIRNAIDHIRIYDKDGKDIFLREMYKNPIRNAHGF